MKEEEKTIILKQCDGGIGWLPTLMKYHCTDYYAFVLEH